jgi:hypothetical protein
MDRFEKSLESSIKVILEYLRRLGPDAQRSEMELERETKEKVVNKPDLLSRLRDNPKIAYDSVSGKYRFKPMYTIRNRAELIELLGKRPTLTVDQDLLDCYAGVEQDVAYLLRDRIVWTVRNADADKMIKCEKAAAEAKENKVKLGTVAKCGLYGSDRCRVCADNKGIVMMCLWPNIPAAGKAADATATVADLWHSETLPILSEVQRAMAASRVVGEMGIAGIAAGDMTHLTMTSTQHMLTKSSIAKLKATARLSQRQRKRAADGKLKTDTISNEHVLEHLMG